MDENGKMSASDVRSFFEDVMVGARPAMRQALGESRAAYDRADAIAEGIRRGVERAVVNAGLAEDSDG